MFGPREKKLKLLFISSHRKVVCNLLSVCSDGVFYILLSDTSFIGARLAIIIYFTDLSCITYYIYLVQPGESIPIIMLQEMGGGCWQVGGQQVNHLLRLGRVCSK